MPKKGTLKGGEASKKDKEYRVGYKKPPLQTRWQKGQSGNRSGRRKNPKPEPVDELTPLTKVLMRQIQATEGGETKMILAWEALNQKRLELALKGNLKAINSLLADAHKEGFFELNKKFRLATMWAGAKMHKLTDAELESLENVLVKIVSEGARAELAGEDPEQERDDRTYRVGIAADRGDLTMQSRHATAQEALVFVERALHDHKRYKVVSVDTGEEVSEDALRWRAQLSTGPR